MAGRREVHGVEEIAAWLEDHGLRREDALAGKASARCCGIWDPSHGEYCRRDRGHPGLHVKVYRTLDLLTYWVREDGD
jgi:hypothetical protein